MAISRRQWMALHHADRATSDAIRPPGPRTGWGAVKVSASIGATEWKTSVFPDKDGCYVLPVKAEVRKREKIEDGDTVDLELTVL